MSPEGFSTIRQSVAKTQPLSLTPPAREGASIMSIGTSPLEPPPTLDTTDAVNTETPPASPQASAIVSFLDGEPPNCSTEQKPHKWSINQSPEEKNAKHVEVLLTKGDFAKQMDVTTLQELGTSIRELTNSNELESLLMEKTVSHFSHFNPSYNLTVEISKSALNYPVSQILIQAHEEAGALLGLLAGLEKYQKGQNMAPGELEHLQQYGLYIKNGTLHSLVKANKESADVVPFTAQQVQKLVQVVRQANTATISPELRAVFRLSAAELQQSSEVQALTRQNEQKRVRLAQQQEIVQDSTQNVSAMTTAVEMFTRELEMLKGKAAELSEAIEDMRANPLGPSAKTLEVLASYGVVFHEDGASMTINDNPAETEDLQGYLSSQMGILKGRLADTTNDLIRSKERLARASGELESQQAELARLRQDLSASQEQLDTATRELSQLGQMRQTAVASVPPAQRPLALEISQLVEEQVAPIQAAARQELHLTRDLLAEVEQTFAKSRQVLERARAMQKLAEAMAEEMDKLLADIDKRFGPFNKLNQLNWQAALAEQDKERRPAEEAAPLPAPEPTSARPAADVDLEFVRHRQLRRQSQRASEARTIDQHSEQHRQARTKEEQRREEKHHWFEREAQRLEAERQQQAQPE